MVIQITRKIERIVLLISASWVITCCVPDIYVIDRHTMMEMEASGQWPELDQKIYLESLSLGPIPLPDEGDSKRKKRVFSVLTGELKDEVKK